MTTEERGSVERKAEEREHLRQIIKQWNANRLELFELTVPNEELEFHGVMRYYFQDAGQKVATKCIRVSSTASADDVIQTLIEKFRPDIRMLSVPEYALFEIHENGEERNLAEDEKPLLVQLNWHKDDREGRFLLRRMDEKTYLPGFEQDAINFKRKLSKREKKDKKKREKKEKKSKENSNRVMDGIAEKLYSELPETSFTRSISNPEAVMRRRRQQKLEKKLQQLCQEGGTEAGGTVRIFGETLNKDVPYKTLLLSTRDEAAHVVREILDKYGKNKEKDAPHYCLVQLIVPHNKADGIREYILEDDDCPLAIEKQHFRSRGTLSFHIKQRPADYQPCKRKMRPKLIEAESEDGILRRPHEDQFTIHPSVPVSDPTSHPHNASCEAEVELEPLATDPRKMEQLLKLLLLQANDQLPPDQRDSLNGLSQERASELLTQTGHLGHVQVGPKIDVIYLQKGNNGMGLSIVATKGIGQDMHGIYIKSVVKGGAAEKDGRLQAGDQLLKVDGHSLIGISQERAAELMTQTGPVVTLDVAKQAAAFNGLAAFLHQPSPPIPRVKGSTESVSLSVEKTSASSLKDSSETLTQSKNSLLSQSGCSSISDIFGVDTENEPKRLLLTTPAEWECVQTLDRASIKAKQKRVQAQASTSNTKTSSHISLPLGSKPFAYLKGALLPQKLLQLKQKSPAEGKKVPLNTLAQIKEAHNESAKCDHPQNCSCKRCCTYCRPTETPTLSATGKSKSKSDDSLCSNTASVSSCSSCCSICCTENYTGFYDCLICQEMSAFSGLKVKDRISDSEPDPDPKLDPNNGSKSLLKLDPNLNHALPRACHCPACRPSSTPMFPSDGSVLPKDSTSSRTCLNNSMTAPPTRQSCAAPPVVSCPRS